MTHIRVYTITNRSLLTIHIQHDLTFLGWVLNLMDIKFHNRIFLKVFLMIRKYGISSGYFVRSQLCLDSRIRQG